MATISEVSTQNYTFATHATLEPTVNSKDRYKLSEKAKRVLSIASIAFALLAAAAILTIGIIFLAKAAPAVLLTAMVIGVLVLSIYNHRYIPPERHYDD